MVKDLTITALWELRMGKLLLAFYEEREGCLIKLDMNLYRYGTSWGFLCYCENSYSFWDVINIAKVGETHELYLSACKD